MSKLSIIFSIGLTSLLVACNSTTIYNESSGGFSSVTTSSSLNYAESNAQKDIEKHCKKAGKGVAMTHHETQYNGTTTSNKIVGALVGGIISPGFNPAVSDSDYVVRTRFICR